MLSLSWKINRGSVIGLCINTTPEKIGIEKGSIPKGDDARIPVELYNKISWEYRGIDEDSAMVHMRDGMLILWRINITRGLMRYLNITS